MAVKTAGTWMALDQIGINPDSTVGTTLLYPLGTRVKARDVGATGYGDGEFIYLEGVASTVRGSVVLITDAYATLLIDARHMGAVAVALGINAAAASYGWYQILGKGVATCETVSANLPCYIGSTNGFVDDAVVAGDAIIGMRTVSASDTSTCVVNMATYPAVSDYDNA